ncbi:MAG: radical SAM protein [Gammaproteobacteria bacterium]
MTFFVTRRCNARCPYCFYLESKDKPQRQGEELTLKEIQRISQSMGKLLWLAFSGGEPFLRKDLADISRIFYMRNRPAIMLYPSNGLMPELIRETMERILAECPDSVITVKLSIDELGEQHNRLRNTPHSFEKALETYRLLVPLLERHPNFELGINTVFCSENQDSMDGIIDFVAGLEHAPVHTISMVRGRLKKESYKAVDYGKYARAAARLAGKMKDRSSSIYRFRGARLKAAQDILQRRLIHQTLHEQKRHIPCYAGRLSLVLTETGDVYPCEILTAGFGNIRDHDYDMRKIIGSQRAKQVIDPILDKRCHCTHECNLIMNILFNPRLYPPLLKEYLQL